MTDTTVRYDFKPFKQGADWTRTLEFKSNESAVDLSGYTAKMTIRDKPTVNGAELLTIQTTTPTTNGSVITMDGVNGLITLSITDDDTDGFNWTKAYYDLKLISGDSDAIESVPIYGELTVIPKVTV